MRIRTGKTPKRELGGPVVAIEKAYAELREEVIHVPHSVGLSNSRGTMALRTNTS